MLKIENYLLAIEELTARTEHETDTIANLSNASAILNEYMDDINWVGFYLYKNQELVLGPFQGKAARVRIALGNGVCGTAFQEKKILIVPDVHKFSGHIACDCASNSEIVIPMYDQGIPVGVLDIDSPILNRFDETDKQYLKKFTELLVNTCKW